MTKKAVKKEVKRLILEGKTKQEAYDELKGISKMKAEDLAKIVQSVPSLNARDKYRSLNIVLIGLLSLTVALKMLSGLPIVIEKGIAWFPVLLFLPLINIILLIGVSTYNQSSYKFVAILAILGLFRLLRDLLSSSFDTFIIIDVVFAAGLIGLGFYLGSKLFPNYTTVKERYQNSQGQDRMRNVIKFED